MHPKTENMKKLRIYCHTVWQFGRFFTKISKTEAIVSIVSRPRHIFNQYILKIMVNTFYFDLSFNIGCCYWD